MAEAPFDVKRAHRWFAVELNNLAWELIEAPQRDDAQIEQMINAAHGACFHWAQVGDILNQLRGEQLLASAYVTAILPVSAVRHAKRAVTLLKQVGDKATPFDVACTHGCAGAAFALAGEDPQAKDHLVALRDAVDKLEHEGEKKVIRNLYFDGLVAKYD